MKIHRSALVALFALLSCSVPDAVAQDHSDTITIDYPEALPLVGLVDYATRVLDIRILYGDELQGKTAELRPAPITIPRDRLLPLVRSVLRMHGLALVEDELERFYRVVTSADLPRVITEIRAPDDTSQVAGDRIVTQAIKVASGQTKRVASQLKAFVSSPQSSFIEVPESGVILVTDYEDVVGRLGRVVSLIDAEPKDVITRIAITQRSDLAILADQVRRITEAKWQKAKPDTEFLVLDDVVPDGLVLIGTETQVAAAQRLLTELDVVADRRTPTRSYVPQHISASRLKSLIEQLVLGDATQSGSVKLFVDEATNRLYVTASPSVHDQVLTLFHESDSALPQQMRPMRTYRPKHRSADEILDTLTHLLEEATVSIFAEPSVDESMGTGEQSTRAPTASRRVQSPPVPPRDQNADSEPDGTVRFRRVEGPDYVLTVDTHTNTIIAIGAPEFHTQLQALIDELDKRRAQVLVEMTLVAISLSDSLDVGIELEFLELGGGGLDHLLFSSLGMSTVDMNTGQRILEPGLGANGVLITPDMMPIIVRALATNGKSRVISTTRVLVSDNSTGVIRSVEEAPFTSINASDTVATTSFAGFESAGTTLTVTPHIADGDHLSLEYDLSFSNFTGAATDATAPPPRSTNSFTSIIEVPDGYTVVVGGLIVDNESDSVSEVPLLGRIPVLGAFFQRSMASLTRSRVFAFIRPMVLRDDRFADLKFVTQAQLDKAELENQDYPPDNRMWMR